MPSGDSGTIVGAIGRHPVDRRKYAVVSGDNGRHACTHWSLEERLGDYSLLRFKLDTGRTHQIRRHLADKRYPVLGDKKYAGTGHAISLQQPRQMLHAYRLIFPHPHTKKIIRATAPMPSDIKHALKQLKLR